MEVQAFAKLNLTLDILGKRPDGYHDLRMVMQSITLADTLTLEENQGEGLRVSANLRFLPTGEKNLAAAAALRFWEALGRGPEDLDIHIQKRIQPADIELDAAVQGAILGGDGETLHMKMGGRNNDEIEPGKGIGSQAKASVLVNIRFAAKKEADAVPLRQRQGLRDMGIILAGIELKGYRKRLVPEMIGQAKLAQAAGGGIR